MIMSIEGVWKLEIAGLNGWEGVATVFMDDGRSLSASADHYSVGDYHADGNAFTVETSAIQHGNVRTLFGHQKKRLDISLNGDIRKDDSIVGKIHPRGSNSLEVNMRLSRLGDIV